MKKYTYGKYSMQNVYYIFNNNNIAKLYIDFIFF